MSFVSNLRMRNMFPINSDLGNARIDESDLDIGQIINAARQIQQRPAGIQSISNAPEPQPQGLRYGGGSGPSNNDFHRKESMDLYDSYNKLNIAPGSEAYGGGGAADERYAENYFKRKNEETRANATLAAAGNRGWETATITDPETNEQKTVRINKQDGRVEPLDIGNNIVTNKDTPNNIQKRLDAQEAKTRNKKYIENNTNDILNVLNQLSEEDIDPVTNQYRGEKVKSLGNITGWQGNLPPWLLDAYSPNATNRQALSTLKSMLALNKIQEMRGMTKTGGSPFGSNVNAKEFQTLMNAATQLEAMNQDDSAFANHFSDIRKSLKNILQQNADDTPDTGGMNMASGHTPTNAPVSKNPNYKYVRNATNDGWTAVRIAGK